MSTMTRRAQKIADFHNKKSLVHPFYVHLRLARPRKNHYFGNFCLLFEISYEQTSFSLRFFK